VPRPPAQWTTPGCELIGTWQPPASGLPILLGVDITGALRTRDLLQAPHVLIAGTTGSGKSVCLHGLLLSLLITCAPTRLQLLLVDPKRVEFAAYQGLPHLLAPVVVDAVEATRRLNELVKEMERREKLLETQGAREWSDLGDMAPARIVVVVEELADLFAQSPEAEAPLVRLAQKARAAGIHLLLATQRPDAATFSGLLRTNIPSRIALTVQKASDSRIVLDESGAEKLLGKGDVLVKWVGEAIQRVHALNIRPTDIKQVLHRWRTRG